jgi:hypothetical protein
MRRRGRPVLGAISGLFLGIFVSVDLMMFNVMPFDTFSVAGLPLIGLILGIVIGMFAPFGRRSAPPAGP